MILANAPTWSCPETRLRYWRRAPNGADISGAWLGLVTQHKRLYKGHVGQPQSEEMGIANIDGPN